MDSRLCGNECAGLIESDTFCRLADTGSFELPADVQASINNAADFDYTLTRLATTVVVEGNAAFVVVSRSTSEN